MKQGSRTKNTLPELEAILNAIEKRKFNFDGMDAESVIADIKADIAELKQ